MRTLYIAGQSIRYYCYHVTSATIFNLHKDDSSYTVGLQLSSRPTRRHGGSNYRIGQDCTSLWMRFVKIPILSKSATGDRTWTFGIRGQRANHRASTLQRKRVYYNDGPRWCNPSNPQISFGIFIGLIRILFVNYVDSLMG